MVSSKPTSETRSSKLKSNPGVERDVRVQYIAREPRLLARPLRPQAHRSAREHSAPRVLRHGRIVSLAGLSTPRGMAASAAPQRRTSCRAAVAAVLSTAVAISPPLQRIIDSTAIVIAHRRRQAPLMRRPCVADSQDCRHDVERNAVARSSRRLQAAERPLTSTPLLPLFVR